MTAPASIPAPMASQPAPANAELEKQRSTIVAQKIIKLQEWLEKQKTAAPSKQDADDDQPIAMAARPMPRPPRAEEKRVGWTD